MNYLKQLKRITPGAWGFLASLFVLLASGCGRESIQVYTVPKEKEQALPAVAQDPHTGDMMGATAQPKVTWKLPAGWQERSDGAEQMRVASFMVPNQQGGPDGDAAIIPLPTMAGKEVVVANIWRKQVGKPELSQEEFEKETKPVEIGPKSGTLLDIAGTEPAQALDNKYPMRILVAYFTEGQTSWFFKLTGESSFVEKHKAEFLDFLKSIEFKPGSDMTGFTHGAIPPGAGAGGPMAASAPVDNSALPKWQPPTEWQPQPPSQFLLAKFLVPNPNGPQAEINISALGGNGGGELENVNRWRRQLALAAIDQAELKTLAETLDASGSKAILVDMTGTNAKTGQSARMLGVIVPQAEQTWFYKLMGDKNVVEKEKAAFLKFVQTVNYSHDP